MIAGLSVADGETTASVPGSGSAAASPSGAPGGSASAPPAAPASTSGDGSPPSTVSATACPPLPGQNRESSHPPATAPGRRTRTATSAAAGSQRRRGAPPVPWGSIPASGPSTTSTPSMGVPSSISAELTRVMPRAASRLAIPPAVVAELLLGGIGGWVHPRSQGVSSSSPGNSSRTRSRSRHISSADP